mgnify:CR=1 FL=1|jgi:transcriptional regulator with XRE-family HTH domain
MELNNKIIGQRIFNHRRKKRMSRNDLGKKIDLHETTVKRYEDGDIKNLGVEKLGKFAKALDISLSELLGTNNEDISYKNETAKTAVCPNNAEHKEFVTTVHVVQDWKIDNKGNWIETISDATETASGPDINNIWTCSVCGSEAIFEDYEKITIEGIMEELDKQISKYSEEFVDIIIDFTENIIFITYHSKHDSFGLSPNYPIEDYSGLEIGKLIRIIEKEGYSYCIY